MANESIHVKVRKTGDPYFAPGWREGSKVNGETGLRSSSGGPVGCLNGASGAHTETTAPLNPPVTGGATGT